MDNTTRTARQHLQTVDGAITGALALLTSHAPDDHLRMVIEGIRATASAAAQALDAERSSAPPARPDAVDQGTLDILQTIAANARSIADVLRANLGDAATCVVVLQAVEHVGLLADTGAARAGRAPVVGDVREWLLPPSALAS